MSPGDFALPRKDTHALVKTPEDLASLLLAEHEAEGEALAYTVLPVSEMAKLEDIGEGFRLVKGQ